MQKSTQIGSYTIHVRILLGKWKKYLLFKKLSLIICEVAIFTSLFSNHLEKDSGIGVHYRDLAIGLKESGCKVEVFHFPYECNQSKDYEFESIPIHVLGLPTAKIPRFKGLGFLAMVFKYFDYYEAAQLLKTSKYTLDKFNLNSSFDVIEATSNRGVACGISRLRKRPPIFTRVSTTMKQSFAYEKTKSDLNFRLAARLEEEQIKRSDFLVTHTQSHSKLVSKELSLENSKFKIIPHAISLNQSQNTDPKSYTTSASIRILFVGRLEPRKGFDVLMKAIPIVLKENNDVHFDICGDGEVTKKSALKEFSQNITFHGYKPREELEKLYENCDIFVAPSRYESFGIIYLEAMKYGKPVIACNSGGTPEVVKDGETGILIKPGDFLSLAKAISKLINDMGLRENMGKSGKHRTVSLFSIDQLVHTTLDYYRVGLEKLN